MHLNSVNWDFYFSVIVKAVLQPQLIQTSLFNFNTDITGIKQDVEVFKYLSKIYNICHVQQSYVNI